MDYVKRDLNLHIIEYGVDSLKQEMIISYPDKNLAPGVIFIHGHQGNAYASLFVGKKFLDLGYAICLPSMMGYGNSEGKSDYCGPKTIEAINKGVEIFLEQPQVDKNNIAIYGVSRGAVVASQIITENKFSFKGAILEVGAYDLAQLYNDPRLDPNIKLNIEKETNGASRTELESRSSILKVKDIKTNVLILHGENDLNYPLIQAQLLDEEMQRNNTSHETVIIPNAGHFLGKKGRNNYILPFLKKVFQ